MMTEDQKVLIESSLRHIKGFDSFRFGPKIDKQYMHLFWSVFSSKTDAIYKNGDVACSVCLICLELETGAFGLNKETSDIISAVLFLLIKERKDAAYLVYKCLNLDLVKRRVTEEQWELIEPLLDDNVSNSDLFSIFQTLGGLTIEGKKEIMSILED